MSARTVVSSALLASAVATAIASVAAAAPLQQVNARRTHGCVAIVIATAIILLPLPSAATPCTPDIDRAWAQVNVKIQARIGAGRSAPQSNIALLHHQPTAKSVAAARDILNDVWLPIEAAVSSLSRARQADKDNDDGACREALIEAQHAIQR
jgi:hypothetical protein